MRASTSPLAPKGNEWIANVGQALTASGSTQGTATAIPAGQDLSVFTTVPAGSGCILPAGLSAGEEYMVANHTTGSALNVYPPVGGFMGAAAQNAAYSLAAGKTGYFTCIGQNRFTVNP